MPPRTLLAALLATATSSIGAQARSDPWPQLATSLPGAGVAADTVAGRADLAGAPGVATATLATAVRVSRAPVLDGRDHDEAWAVAQTIDRFRVFDPVEDGEPRLRTVAKVTYDDRHLYVLVRAFDPRPDSIVSLLSRRDVRTASDQIKVMVDSYHDRRTGYEFAVNPAGVKRDIYTYNDANEDASWDAVWDAATAIDSLGWVAEFRIPLSQLRFPNRPTHTFGIMVTRDVQRTGERYSWPVFRRSKPGISSQFGDLAGIAGLATPRRLEVTPYAVTQNVSDERRPDVGYPRRQQLAVGADVKYGLTSNLTVDAAINPDFGQVEADPAVLNLSAFEQFFAERRPFFLEGTGIFSFNLECNDGSCTGLFYSRRVGRGPQLRGLDGYADAATPTSTTILGATKLTGRTRRGLSLGVLDAVTQREQGLGERTVEPQTNYLVARLQQDLRGGNSGVGLMITGVNRAVDEWSDAYVRRDAYAGGLDFRHRFARNTYELSGYVVGSYVAGDTAALNRTQRSPVHNLHRPDGRLRYDPTRTSLAGDAQQISFGKTGGPRTRFNVNYQRFSPGFEINDAGFLRRADQQVQSNWFALRFQEPRHFYRRAQVNFNQWNTFTAGGLRTNLGGNVNANAQFKNFLNGYVGVGAEQLGGALDDRATRGGPAVRRSPTVYTFSGLNGDDRKAWVPWLNFYGRRSDYGRSRYYEVSPGLEFRASSRFSMSVSPRYSVNDDDAQWLENVTDSTAAAIPHYLFARLEQRTASVRTRINLTATPNLSVQLYAEPFISNGRYSKLRELGSARAGDYEQRFVPFSYAASAVDGPADDDPGGFNFKQLRSTSVLRWEYRPGSAIFLVWQQGRDESIDHAGRFDVGRDVHDLFSLRPRNTFLIKGSYWLSL